MLTFEDFFVRKKIDLTALKQSNLPLYEEFKSHYIAMGEKSFDHTKKFWFNRLRKNYRLQEVESPKRITIPTTPAAQSDVKKGSNDPVLVTEPTDTASKTVASAADPINEQPEVKKPTGFKPRFKAGVAKPVANEQSTNEETENKASEEAPAASKPAAFKPRFKAGVTKPAANEQSTNEETESKASEEAPAASKSAGFKPRFKAGVTKPATDSDIKKNNQQ